MKSNDLIKILIGARYPILYIVSWEEERVEGALEEIAIEMGKRTYLWSATKGMETSDGKLQDITVTEPIESLKYVMKSQENAVFVLKDFHAYLDTSFHTRDLIVRCFRDLSRELSRTKKTIIILSPILTLPGELEKEITVIDYDLPTVEDLNGLFSRVLDAVEKNSRLKVQLEHPEDREKILRAALGLTLKEAENVFAKAVVMDGVFDVSDVEVILAEKEQIIRKSGLLEYYKVEERFENVGGLGNLKRWLRKRANAFTTKARDFGLPEPKGVLLIGVPGCGKSLTAKAVSALWGMPLLRLDMGSVFGKYIGESEFNIRKAIKVTESISPAILWIDEIEKGLSGAAGDNTGTSNRVFGTLLTWMQEKKKPVFVIATANDVSLLPPELLRKVRFDEIFFIDLPETRERQEIFEIHLRIRNRNPEKFDLPSLAEMSQGFSGSEIEQVVISSLYDAFEEGRDIVTEDVKRNIENAVPLSQTMKEKIEALREWAWGRTRNAS